MKNRSQNSLRHVELKKEVLEAEGRIRKYIRETPVEYSPHLSQIGDCSVFLKLENIQLSGSFKLRGVMNKLLSLTKRQRGTGLVTASTGNHGAAFAYGLKKLGLKGTIYLPTNASRVKIEALRHYGIELKFHGTDCVETEAFARRTANEKNFLYISPYNDLKVIAGHATIAVELLKQVKKLDAVFVPIGGGGLISGIGGYLKSEHKRIKIIGCQPQNSAVMVESIKAGKIIELDSKPTISDGTAGGIEKGSITFDLCRSYVDDFVLVSEEEIKEAIGLLIEKHHLLVEGSGALSVASFIKTRKRFGKKNVALILTGARIGPDQLKEVICS